jgi:maleylacetate reductase
MPEVLRHIYRPPGLEQILSGVPVGEAVASLAVELGAQRILLVTSHSMTNGPLVSAIADALGHRHAGTYGGVRPHSPRDCVLEGAAAIRQAGADLLIALGGGSVIDAVKVMQLCAWSHLRDEGDLARYRAAAAEGVAPPIDRKGALRSIAVPTTLSAAEFNTLAGVTDPATGRKEPYQHPLMIPRAVVLDPAVLASVPAEIILSTGIRAVDHCVETYCSSRAWAFSDALAIGALKLLWTRLPEVKSGAATRATYADLQLAAWMAIAGPASGTPVGASHAIGRILGAVANVAHGHTSAILLPAVLRWSALDASAARRQKTLAAELGSEAVPLPDVLANFFASLDQPRRLAEVAVGADQFETIAAYSVDMLRHPSVDGNNPAVTTASQVAQILAIAA